jgi:hypothetical protein
MAHTPTPWKVIGGTIILSGDERKRWIGEVPPSASDFGDFEEDRANARFIVIACNTHDELLVALKNLTQACWQADMDGDLSEHIDGSLLNAADSAIAKAEAANG